jgi:hypothetical protein
MSRHTHLSRRNIISIDVESNGLYGQPFCVGAVEMDWGGRVINQFFARCPLDEVEDDWVLEHVLPTLQSIANSHESLEEVQADFTTWLANSMARSNNPIVLVDAGFPVDCNFLYEAIKSESKKSGRQWIGKRYSPYPLLDLASVLAGAGFDPDADRAELAEPIAGPGLRDWKHHPKWDAELSALCLIVAIRKMEERSVDVHE